MVDIKPGTFDGRGSTLAFELIQQLSALFSLAYVAGIFRNTAKISLSRSEFLAVRQLIQRS